jgi:regulation of enolase protein 1 (concanavalin A-like superfamily)
MRRVTVAVKLTGAEVRIMKLLAQALAWQLAAWALLAASARAQDGPFETGWDKPVDPDGDCQFRRDKDALTIVVPGRHHDLVAESDVMNAPRLLRDVEGEFTAQVRVDGYFRPTIQSTFNKAVPFIGAGLVVMDGDKTYARLERAGMYRNDQFGQGVLWELRVDGKPAGSKWPNFAPAEDKPLYLRLQRKGDRLQASVSADGDKWTDAEPLDVKLPAKVKVGIAAVSTSEVRFKPRFDEFRLTTGE